MGWETLCEWIVEVDRALRRILIRAYTQVRDMLIKLEH